MRPSPAFFGIQRAFAHRWAELAGCPDDQAYLECTTWYHQVCRLGRDFDPRNSAWRRFLADLAEAEDPVGFIHRTVAAFGDAQSPSASVFDYAWDPDTRTARLHFEANGSNDVSPLAHEAMRLRQREVGDVIARALSEHPQAAWVRGKSWLYNLEAYRRLFPPSFIAGLTAVEHDLQFLASWGQFLDRRGDTRAAMVEPFLARIAAASTTTELEDAFPFRILETRAPVADFVEFYRGA